MASSGERITNKILRNTNIEYEREFKILPFRKFRTDFICKYFLGDYFVIEIDGEQHNGFFARIYDIIRDYHIKRLAKTKIYRVNYKNLKYKVKAILFIEKLKVYLRIAFLIYLVLFLYNNIELILFIIKDNLHYLKNFNYLF